MLDDSQGCKAGDAELPRQMLKDKKKATLDCTNSLLLIESPSRLRKLHHNPKSSPPQQSPLRSSIALGSNQSSREPTQKALTINNLTSSTAHLVPHPHHPTSSATVTCKGPTDIAEISSKSNPVARKRSIPSTATEFSKQATTAAAQAWVHADCDCGVMDDGMRGMRGTRV